MSKKINALSNYLVESILNEEFNIKKTVVIYPGRFQPMGKHHAETFNWVKKKFPTADCYIATSDKVDLPKSPFTFNEKKKIINGYGIKNVVQVKNPYIAAEILNKYDAETTAVIFIVGTKDMDEDPRFKIGFKKGGYPSYFQDYAKHKDNMVGYKEHGYLLTAPHITLNVPGYGEMSGTQIRKSLGDKSIDDKTRHELFKGIFGHDNKSLYDLVVGKLISLNEIMESFIIASNYPEIINKLKTNIVNEISTSTMQAKHFVDDGPNMFDDTNKRFKGRSDDMTKRLGWDVVDYIMGDTEMANNDVCEFPNGPVTRVSYMPSGVHDKFGDNIEMNNDSTKLKSNPTYTRWSDYIRHIATQAGMQLIEGSTSTGQGASFVDDAAHGFINARKDFSTRNSKLAKDLGWEVVDFMLTDENYDDGLVSKGQGPIDDVSFMSKGIESTSSNKSATSTPGYNKWKNYINAIASTSGYEIIKYTMEAKNGKHKLSFGARQLVEAFHSNLDILKSHIPSQILQLMQYMIENKIQRRSVNIKDEDKFKQFMHDVKYAVDNKWLIVKRNPISKTEVFISLGPSAQKMMFNESLIIEGGAYGHMSHPFDNNDLTFGDFKEMIRQSLTGELSVGQINEKSDGQNIMVTWKGGELKAARNKSQIKTPISISELSQMFAGRGDIHDAFVFAMKDLSVAISKLSDKNKTKIFDNGKNYMNLEIIYPATKNVIDYDKSILQFHGSLIYDDAGNVVGEVVGSGTMLSDMIKKVNQSIQSHFNIESPNILTINKGINFGENQDKFIGQLSKLQNEFQLKDTDTLAMYHQAWWDNFINKKANSMKYAIPNNVLVGLIKRWAFQDKGYGVNTMKKEITDTSFLDWALGFDKTDHQKQWKINISPFETIFLGLGAEVLKNVEGFLSANPDKTVQDIRKQVAATIKIIRNSGDLSSIDKMNVQLKRIQAIGGFKQIVPAEGLVFKYKGNTYKFSGIFAPINSLLGIIRYSR